MSFETVLSQWFYQKDVIIDVISFLVLLLSVGVIGFLVSSTKSYNIIRQKGKYIKLLTAFALMAIGFLSKIVTVIGIYMMLEEQREIEVITITQQTLATTNTFFFIGLLINKILIILGLYILYSVYLKKQTKSGEILTIYLLLALGYLSNTTYYIFHITAMILLILITEAVYRSYRKQKDKKTLMLALSFGTLALSEALEIFIMISALFYIFSEFIQLIGFILLLLTFIMVFIHGKKKKSNRYN